MTTCQYGCRLGLCVVGVLAVIGVLTGQDSKTPAPSGQLATVNNDTASLPTPANVAQLSIGKFVVWVERGVGTEQYPDFPKTEYFHRPVLAFIPCSEPVGDFPKAVHGVVRRKDKRTAVTFKVMMSSKSLVAACADLVRKAPLEAENIKGKEDKINVRCAFITDIYVMMVDTADYQGDPKDQANSVLATCHVQGLEYIDPMSPAEFVMLMDDEAVDRLKLAKSKPTSLSWVFLYKYRGKSIGQSQVKFTMQADLKKVLEQRLGSDQLSGEAYITQGQVNQVAMALAASIRGRFFRRKRRGRHPAEPGGGVAHT